MTIQIYITQLNSTATRLKPLKLLVNIWNSICVCHSHHRSWDWLLIWCADVLWCYYTRLVKLTDHPCNSGVQQRQGSSFVLSTSYHHWPSSWLGHHPSRCLQRILAYGRWGGRIGIWRDGVGGWWRNDSSTRHLAKENNTKKAFGGAATAWASPKGFVFQMYAESF